MALLSDVASTLKNVVLMQSNLDRLERVVEGQNATIAGLREVIAAMNERIVRIETKFEVYERLATQRRIEG